jgi:hypothetical protein
LIDIRISLLQVCTIVENKEETFDLGIFGLTDYTERHLLWNATGCLWYAYALQCVVLGCGLYTFCELVLEIGFRLHGDVVNEAREKFSTKG